MHVQLVNVILLAYNTIMMVTAQDRRPSSYAIQFHHSHQTPPPPPPFNIQQVSPDELPPGEYDILAMFDAHQQQEQRSAGGKSLNYRPQSEYVRPPGSDFEVNYRGQEDSPHSAYHADFRPNTYHKNNDHHFNHYPIHGRISDDHSDPQLGLGNGIVKSLPPRSRVHHHHHHQIGDEAILSSFPVKRKVENPESLRQQQQQSESFSADHQRHLLASSHPDSSASVVTFQPPPSNHEFEEDPSTPSYPRSQPLRDNDHQALPDSAETQVPDIRLPTRSKSRIKSSKVIVDLKKARNPLERLKEIAGEPLKGSGSASEEPATASFRCTEDGHFGDPDDCSKFYRCAHGIALPDYCPADLLWNSATEQCDWPDETTCQSDADNPSIKKVEHPAYLYLTFDDGPNEGTEAVLDVLQSEDVKATFFINSQALFDAKRDMAERNARGLLRSVDEGHTLADHSFNHMLHNSNNSPVNAYANLDTDLKYFGSTNINPVIDFLWGNGRRDQAKLQFVNDTMSTLVRMPYTNNWRLPSLKISSDCSSCTIPSSSAQIGIQIANQLAAEGRSVFGWDLEWAVDWNQNRHKYPGTTFYRNLARARRTSWPGKIVLLSHDIAFRPGGPRDEREELKRFIQLAKQSGYIFRTLDTYSTD